jgi:Fe-S oxidoreductase/nitrate reductase gamma subunit
VEATREIYWNVGGGTATLVPMYLFTVIAAALLVWGFAIRIPVYRRGRPLPRLGEMSRRIGRFLVFSLAQARVMNVRRHGIPHAVFFWGFLLLFIGTTLVLLQADFTDPLWDYRFLEGPFYLGFSLTLDLAGLTAILTLLYFAVRRFVVRPPGLPTRWDDYLIHGLLLTILVTGFVIEGARIAVTEVEQNPDLARWSPVGLAVATLVGGLSEGSLRTLHEGMWWFHLFLTIAFVVSIPFTKLKHMFTSAANYLFAPHEAAGYLPTLDLEDEEAERYGAAAVEDLSWKDVYDSDACMSCKRCQDRCPAWATGKPLNPMHLIHQLGDAAFRPGLRVSPADAPPSPGARPPWQSALPEPAGADGPVLTQPVVAPPPTPGDLPATVTHEVLWECTTCRACQHICPASIEHVNKILDMRRALVLMEGEFPGEEVRLAMENYEVNSNPFGTGFASRAEWAAGLPVTDLSEEPETEIDLLYFVGCFAAFDRRNQSVARSLVRLLESPGLRVGILGKAEKCCGDPPRKLGNEYLYQMMAQENIEALAAVRWAGGARGNAAGGADAAGGARGADGADAAAETTLPHVVTSCPHCYHALSVAYRDLGLDLEVEHYATLVARLTRQGRLAFAGEPFTAAYHDACYLSRYRDIIEAPRELVRAAGGTLADMRNQAYETFCCGGGGGMVLREERLGRRVAVTRVEMALDTEAPLLVSSCPYCLTNFEDGVKVADAEARLKTRDLAEILTERLLPTDEEQHPPGIVEPSPGPDDQAGRPPAGETDEGEGPR